MPRNDSNEQALRTFNFITMTKYCKEHYLEKQIGLYWMCRALVLEPLEETQTSS